MSGRKARPRRRAPKVAARRTSRSSPAGGGQVPSAGGSRARRRGRGAGMPLRGRGAAVLAPSGGARRRGGAALQALDQLVEAELLEALADRLELAGAPVDQLAALAAQLERLAQAGLAGVQPLDDLLDARRGVFVGLLDHDSESSTRARTAPSWKRTRTSSAARASSAWVTRAPPASSTSA